MSIDNNGNINTDKLILESSRHMPMPSKELRSGEILIKAKGGNNRAILFEQQHHYPVFPTSYFLVLSVINPDITSTEFMVWLLNQPDQQYALQQLTIEGTTMKYLTKSRISELNIYLPSIARQQQFLQLDQKLNERKKVTEALNKLNNEYIQASLDNYMRGQQ